jgi:hypothetical protein
MRSIPTELFHAATANGEEPDSIAPQKLSTPTAVARDAFGTTSKAAGKMFSDHQRAEEAKTDQP